MEVRSGKAVDLKPVVLARASWIHATSWPPRVKRATRCCESLAEEGAGWYSASSNQTELAEPTLEKERGDQPKAKRQRVEPGHTLLDSLYESMLNPQ
ncbi:hypothetical protein NHX12_010250 [Muraenolepis orangiensis]|uniref:Uncharacterized protein n=1 Tax=Muraenolepis orangiensis TaxID=630683 RepID=A0A9Q0I8Q6_9TELE|nr:hypothetical protein NHX12_010250 [Muraenolepis orangiensis]